MNDPLAEFLRAAAERPSLLRAFDCCGRFTASWVECCNGIDPGRDWWGRYKTPFGLARMVKRRGGLVAHFDDCLASAGLSRTETPERGAVAVVAAAEGETGAVLVSGGLSACIGPKGLWFRPLPILAAWRF